MAGVKTPAKAKVTKTLPQKAAKKVAQKPAKKAAPKAAKKPGAARPAAAKKFLPRADLGAPIDAFFVKHPPHLRAVLDELRAMVDEAAPEATSSIKWGMPFYTLDNQMMCALAGFKTHVNLILAGPPGTYADPDGLLEGDGKTGRHLKVRALDQLPRAAVRGWLRTAAALARQQGRAG
jgi:hypothetical protein